MKNSSGLLAEIDRKRNGSSSGWLRLPASSSTRRLNSSQESSRLMKRVGLCGLSTWLASAKAGGASGSPPGRLTTTSGVSVCRLAGAWGDSTCVAAAAAAEGRRAKQCLLDQNEM